MSKQPRPRRRAVQLSDIDRKRLERGEPPTWLDPDGEPQLAGDSDSAQVAEQEQSNDQRLLSDVPPHWSPLKL